LVSAIFIGVGYEIRKNIFQQIKEKKQESEFQARISGELAKKAKDEVNRFEKVVKSSLRNMWIIIYSMAVVNIYGYAYS
jgi:anaerobic C4-dicarboxylate transporter